LMFSDGPVYNFFFAPLFIVVAILFAGDIFAKRTEFKLPDRSWRRYQMEVIGEPHPDWMIDERLQ